MPEFKTWSNENLAQFATDSYIKMIEQNERIETLQRDVKDALQAYRELLRKNPSA